jgi:hypothetical protein
MREVNPALRDAQTTAARCLRAANITSVPSPADFSNLAFGLNPTLWPIHFETHVTSESIRDEFSERISGGPLRRHFERQVIEALTQRLHGVVRSEPADEEKDAVHMLGGLLAQLAAHWVSGQEENASAFLSRWAPLIDDAKKVVTDIITPSMLSRLLGEDESKDFTARSLLDPTRLPSYIASNVETILRRPKFASRDPKGKDSGNGNNPDRLPQKLLKKRIKFDDNAHKIANVNGYEIVCDKVSGNRLGRRA